jgi:hypothetical protein
MQLPAINRRVLDSLFGLRYVISGVHDYKQEVSQVGKKN